MNILRASEDFRACLGSVVHDSRQLQEYRRRRFKHILFCVRSPQKWGPLMSDSYDAGWFPYVFQNLEDAYLNLVIDTDYNYDLVTEEEHEHFLDIRP